MSMEVLSRHWEELSRKRNYLNSAVGTKFKDGKDTGVPAIVVYVSRKVPAVELAPEHMVPDQIEGVPTDVVELAPKTWTAGRTSVSQLHPAEQLKKLGAKRTSNPKVALAPPAKVRTPNGAADHTAVAQPIQDQKSCGACLAFDYIGVWETVIAIAQASAGPVIKLSEGHCFF
jgi:hypothetical protein